MCLIYSLQNGTDEGPGARESEDLEHEEQAVNLRRQKRDKSKGSSVKCAARSNSNTSVSGSSKPDNIAQCGSEVERTRDIQHKTTYVSDTCFKPLLPVLCKNIKNLTLSCHEII
jgi:U3 small nucleolar ribonucleoprotein component